MPKTGEQTPFHAALTWFRQCGSKIHIFWPSAHMLTANADIPNLVQLTFWIEVSFLY